MLKYKPKLGICSVHVHATDIFFKTCQSKAHYNMIRQATFNTHAPKLFFKINYNHFYC